MKTTNFMEAKEMETKKDFFYWDKENWKKVPVPPQIQKMAEEYLETFFETFPHLRNFIQDLEVDGEIFRKEIKELVGNKNNPNLMDKGIFLRWEIKVREVYKIYKNGNKRVGEWGGHYLFDELIRREEIGEWWDRR